MEKNEIPGWVKALIRGAAMAAGYYGTKYAIRAVDDWRKDPNRKPIISININKKED